MRVIEISAFGPPEVLQLADRPDPVAAPGEVVIEVAAAGVNRPDVLQRLGRYPPPPGASDLPGLEVAGHISAVGADVSAWAEGDEVCALVNGGGYAERVSVPQEQVLPVPKGLTLIEAAAIPETFFTVWTNVFERGRLARDEWILIHGGTSGIGTTAIQLAAAFGARVLATAGTDEKCAAAVQLGAGSAFNYRTTDWVAAARLATGDHGVDVVLDMVGGDYTPRNIDLLATGGRLVQIAFLKRSTCEIDLAVVMRKRAWITGSTLRPRTPTEKGVIAAELRRHVWPLLESGRVKPVVHEVFPLAQAAAAHRLMEAGTHIGKLVLDLRLPSR